MSVGMLATRAQALRSVAQMLIAGQGTSVSNSAAMILLAKMEILRAGVPRLLMSSAA